MNSEEINCLPDRFFQANPLQHLSAAVIAHYAITKRLNGKFDRLIYSLTEDKISGTRKAKIRQERQRIEETEAPAASVEFMRKGHERFRHTYLNETSISTPFLPCICCTGSTDER